MKLKSCIKGYKRDTHRAVPPEETFTRIEPKMPTVGVTRVAEITGLDRMGIPVFSTIRPTAEGGAVSVYNGKGVTKEEARVSAMMEAIERYSAEVRDRELLVDSYSRFSEKENVLNPKELILPDYLKGVEEICIPWIEGYDLIEEETIFIPANAVFHPLSTKSNRLFRTNTNGLASGNEIEEAIFHGLAEVIERDAWSLVEMSRNTGLNVLINDGIALDLLNKFSDAGVLVYIKDITSDIGIPTFAAVSDDVRLRDPTLLTIGMGNAYRRGGRICQGTYRSRTEQADTDTRCKRGYDKRDI
jgi:ribosomal protein S12 methylthiotransferase accessory factor